MFVSKPRLIVSSIVPSVKQNLQFASNKHHQIVRCWLLCRVPCVVGYTMDTMYFDSIPSPVEIAQDLQMPQFSLENSKVIDCSMNYTSGLYIFRFECLCYLSHFRYPMFMQVKLTLHVNYNINDSNVVPIVVTGYTTFLLCSAAKCQSVWPVTEISIRSFQSHPLYDPWQAAHTRARSSVTKQCNLDRRRAESSTRLKPQDPGFDRGPRTARYNENFPPLLAAKFLERKIAVCTSGLQSLSSLRARRDHDPALVRSSKRPVMFRSKEGNCSL